MHDFAPPNSTVWRGYIWRNLRLSVLIVTTTLNTQVVLAQIEPDKKIATQSKMQQTADPVEITLLEDGDKLVLFNNATCSLNDQDKTELNEENNPWQTIIDKHYLLRLSGLVILEQVKQQAQLSRMVMEIDTEAETKLIIKSQEYSKSVALYSIDKIHETYPRAKMLSQFMEVIELLREAKLVCSPIL